jgi:hypothetical protein
MRSNLPEAEQTFREGLATCKRVLGDGHPLTITFSSYLGVLLKDRGDLADAEPLFREVLETRRRILGETHPDTLLSITNLGMLKLAQGNFQETANLLAPIESDVRRKWLTNSPLYFASFMATLGNARERLGDFGAAEKNLLEAYPVFVQSRGPSNKETMGCVTSIVTLYTNWNKSEPGKGHDAKATEWKSKLDAPPRTATDAQAEGGN